jgi:hypothetical protein
MTSYMAQYKEIFTRVKERDRRLVDVDRYKDEVKKLTMNPNAKPEKLQNVRLDS